MSKKFEKFTKNIITAKQLPTVKGGWVWPHICYLYTELELMPYGPEEEFVYNP